MTWRPFLALHVLDGSILIFILLSINDLLKLFPPFIKNTTISFFLLLLESEEISLLRLNQCVISFLLGALEGQCGWAISLVVEQLGIGINLQTSFAYSDSSFDFEVLDSSLAIKFKESLLFISIPIVLKKITFQYDIVGIHYRHHCPKSFVKHLLIHWHIHG